ncbi:MAG: YabP/YqfC family sporulation protein [bacterium]|nr:YabP/YqfC family sporulation protein [bacterium]
MSYLRDYIQDNEFRFFYNNNQLNVINYLKINYMEDSKISLGYKNGSLIIKGQNLRIRKLLDSEILIIGSIQNIEIRE